MKLLFDQNISFRLIKRISDIFPEADQVKNLGLEDATDMEIWHFAKINGYTIVTFDSDYYDLSLIKGSPPKIIWLRIGNTSTTNLASILRSNYNLIHEFITSETYKDIGCLEINQ